MNKVILMGRLTRDPDVRYSQGANQTAVARYSIAVDGRFRREGDPEADFINCVAFGRQAEFAERFLRKGIKIVLDGRIQTGSYTNREGVKVYTTDVIVEDQEFAESRNASSQSGSGSGSGFAGSFRESESQAPSPAPLPDAGDGFMNIPDGVDDEGLPFQ